MLTVISRLLSLTKHMLHHGIIQNRRQGGAHGDGGAAAHRDSFPGKFEVVGVVLCLEGDVEVLGGGGDDARAEGGGVRGAEGGGEEAREGSAVRVVLSVVQPELPLTAKDVEALVGELDGFPGGGGDQPLADLLARARAGEGDGARGLHHATVPRDVTTAGPRVGSITVIKTLELDNVSRREHFITSRGHTRVLGSHHVLTRVNGKP